ncbi:MAG: hypothetical protein GWO81_00100 [Verrucomicrobia bacterium]|nr:hypothetical protein [Verrucomicrobiota bacterium]
MKKIHLLLTLIVTSGLLFAETKLEYWTFDTDTAGASFDNGSGGSIGNSGSNANLWNHGKVKGMEADGLGHFVVSNTGSAYRRVPAQNYAPAQYSSGRYRLVIEFASWSLDPGNKGSIAFEVSDANNRRIAGVNLYAEKATEAKIRFSATSATGWQGKGIDYAGQSAQLKENRTMRLTIDLDLDNDTVTYFVNGTAVKTINDFNASSIAQIKFFTDSKWSKLSTVKINEMGFLRLPAATPSAGITL